MMARRCLALLAWCVSGEVCEVLRGPVSSGRSSSLKLRVTGHSEAASPYELVSVGGVRYASSCSRPSAGDVLVGVSGASVFNGSLEAAIFVEGDYAFPLSDGEGNVDSFAVVRVDRLRFADDLELTFAKGKGQGLEKIQLQQRQKPCDCSSSVVENQPQAIAASKTDIQKNEEEALKILKKKDSERQRRETAKKAEKERRLQSSKEREEMKSAAQTEAQRETLLEGWARTQKRWPRVKEFHFIKATFPEDKGPLGMSFSEGENAKTVASSVERNRPAEKAGVKVNDELVELRWTARDDDGQEEQRIVNATNLGPSQVRLELKDAAYPRTFVFYRQVLEEEESKESHLPVVLRVTSPSVLRGDVSVGVASWGGAIVHKNCEPALIVLADPPDGCAGAIVSRKSLLNTTNKKIYALATRGVCTFVDKARALALKGNVDGVVISNNAASGLAAMPKGGVRTDDIDVPVIMVDQPTGRFLTTALNWDLDIVEAWLGSASLCRRDLGGSESSPLPLERSPDLKGTIEVQCRSQNIRFDHVAATFGALAENLPMQATMAAPAHLCSLAGVERRLTGSVAIVQRGGGCSFGDKTLVAQKLGATAVVIINTGPDAEAMVADPALKLSIPAVMAPQDFGLALADMAATDPACAQPGAMLLRLRYDDEEEEEE